MNITFLLGNGFDLNLGLATTFSAFLAHYLLNTENDTKIIEQFKTDILVDKKLWSDAEIAFGLYTADFQAKKKTADEYYACYDDFCEKLAEYLDAQEGRIDFNAQANIVSKGFSKSINIENILNNLSEVQKEQILSSVAKFGGGYQYNFIDFNYTTTVDSCIKSSNTTSLLGNRKVGSTVYTNSISSLVHVHGFTSHSMVLGVNDARQIADIELFSGYGSEYTDQLIKVKTNEMNEENTDRKAAQLIQESDLIYVYGMSIGDTDKLWWQRIVERMLKNVEMHLIIHSHSAPKTQLLQRKYMTWVNKAKEGFIEKSGIELTDDQKKLILSRIHIDRKNIFASIKGLNVSEPSSKVVEKAVMGTK